MAEALIGLAGILIGALLGGTGKYWLLRRDAWREARTSGLLLLADVRALRRAETPAASVVSDKELGVRSWASHQQVLAGFRRGNFPNGFNATEWLALAAHFSHLEELWSTSDGDEDDAWWSCAEAELEHAECLLARFEADPAVLWYVLRATFSR